MLCVWRTLDLTLLLCCDGFLFFFLTLFLALFLRLVSLLLLWFLFRLLFFLLLLVLLWPAALIEGNLSLVVVFLAEAFLIIRLLSALQLPPGERGVTTRAISGIKHTSQTLASECGLHVSSVGRELLDGHT